MDVLRVPADWWFVSQVYAEQNRVGVVTMQARVSMKSQLDVLFARAEGIVTTKPDRPVLVVIIT